MLDMWISIPIRDEVVARVIDQIYTFITQFEYWPRLAGKLGPLKIIILYWRKFDEEKGKEILSKL